MQKIEIYCNLEEERVRPTSLQAKEINMHRASEGFKEGSLG